MSFRSRFGKLALTTALVGGLVAAAPLTAQAAAPTAHHYVISKSVHTTFDVVSQPLGDAKKKYSWGNTTVTTFAKFKLSLVRTKDHKVLKSFTGDWYRNYYIEYYLTDQNTGFPVSYVPSYAWLAKKYDAAQTKSTAELKAFAIAHP